MCLSQVVYYFLLNKDKLEDTQLITPHLLGAPTALNVLCGCFTV